MDTNRLEAFSDGVFAIIITIMVLELKSPIGVQWVSLRPLIAEFLSYALSFIFIGIYWNNHHHMLYASEKINGRILWANLHLLFWLSLTPFVTRWMGDNGFASLPVALYGVILLMAAFSYFILAHALVAHNGSQSKLAAALGKDYKGVISIIIYAVAIPLAFFNPLIACFFYVAVAIMWFIPDSRIENALKSEQ